MSELEIFAVALPMTNASERAEYLNGVCGADAAQRQRIEVLLQNHEEAGSFLQSPAGPRLVATQAPTQSEPGDDETDKSALAFLQPSSRPGSLGTLGHYEVLELLGQGGFGTVFRAFDEKLHRMVAIKIMAPQLATTSPARKRFVREARSSAAIRHMNVVDIHAIEEQPIPFLVMEYIGGETLQQRLDRTGPLDPVNVLRIGVQIAQGLSAAHAMGKIHRDIKPANILLENGIDHVKITDFGLARAADDASLTQSGLIAGTPLYMAPEQAQCVALDHRADLFSLGSVFYVMCSGRPPFRAATTLAVLKRVTEDTPRPIREIMPEVPEWLCDIIAKLHAKKPEDRFQTAQEVADVLAKYLTELQRHGKVSQQAAVSNQQEVKSPANTAESGNAADTTLLPLTRQKFGWVPAAAIVVLAVVGLGLSEATNVTNLHGTVIRMFTPEGTLIVEVEDPDVSVTIDGEEIVIKGAGPKEIRVKPGQYRVQASKDGKIVRQEIVTVTKGDRRVVHISREIAPVAKFVPPAKAEPVPPPKIEPMPPIDPDRHAAEYLQSVGGAGYIKWKGTTWPIMADRRLPAGAIELVTVRLIQNQNVTDADLARFKDCKRITELDLRGAEFGDTGLANFKDHQGLERILLAGTNVSDTGLAHFKNCTSVTSLVLRDTKVSNGGLSYFKNCKNLRVLDVTDTDISDEGLAHFKDCTSLTVLYLGRTKVSNVGLAHFQDCKKLELLALPEAQVSNTGLAHFKDCKSLVRLDLSGTKVDDEGLSYFKDCNNLACLELQQTLIGDAGVANFKDCNNLIHLDLSNSQVGDAGLAPFAGCPKLLAVNVKNTKTTEAGVTAFAAALPTCLIKCDAGVIEPTANPNPDRRVAEWLLSLPGHTVLNLVTGGKAVYQLKQLPKGPFQLRVMNVYEHPKVSPETMSIFKGLRHLTHLNIRNCKVTDAELVCFKDCKQLQELQLVGTAVTDAGMAQLAAFANLRYVNVKGTVVTADAVKKLGAALPKCKIEWNGGVFERK